MTRSADGVRFEIVHAATVNWSLIWSGVPFVLSCIGRSAEPPPEGTTLTLSVDLAGRVVLAPVEVRFSAGDLRRGTDVSGTVRALMRTRWLWLNTWQISVRSTATLHLRTSNARFEIALDVLPPVMWHRVLNTRRQLGGPLALRRLRIAPQGIVEEDVVKQWPATLMPPLEAAIAALINPADPFVTLDPLAEGSFADALDEQICNIGGVARRGPMTTLSPPQLLRALYMTILRSAYRHLPPVSAFTDNTQAVRLLQWEHTSGVLCLDVVCLGCAALEARQEKPVFLLVHGGRHALLGTMERARAGRRENELPATADPQQIRTLIEGGRLHLLDVTLALANVSYDEAVERSRWEAFERGFVHAVDIRTARSWTVERQSYSILPYPWPARTNAWVARYLQRLTSELRPAQDTTGGLHDPAELFVSLGCRTDSGERRSLLETRGGHLQERLVEHAGRLAILGDGGGGKTYVCERLAFELAERYLSGNGAVVPIFYRLRFLARGVDDLLSAIAAQVPECGGAAAFEASPLRFLFILDALDESDFGHTADPKQYRRLLGGLDAVAQASVLLTARATLFLGAPDELLPHFEVVTLLGWDESDFDEYLRLAERVKRIDFTGGWRAFHDAIFASGTNVHLRDLTRTPLFARMIVETRKQIEAAAAGETEGIGGEVELYRTYTATCFERREHLVSVELARDVTIEVSRLMYSGRTHGVSVQEIADVLAFHYRQFGIDPWRRIVERDFVVHGLLARQGERELRFSHLSLEHYFLAELVARELERSRTSSGFSALLSHADLEDGVIAFVTQILRPQHQHRLEIGRKLDVIMDERTDLIDESVASRMTGLQADANRLYRNVFLIHVRAGGSGEALDLRELKLSRADLSRTKLARADLTDADLRGATLVETDLTGCRLVGCDLREADVTGASLRSADLAQCDVSFIRIRDPHALPRLFGARNIGRIKLHPDDVTTVALLLRAIATETNAVPSAWAKTASKALRRRIGAES